MKTRRVKCGARCCKLEISRWCVLVSLTRCVQIKRAIPKKALKLLNSTRTAKKQDGADSHVLPLTLSLSAPPSPYLHQPRPSPLCPPPTPKAASPPPDDLATRRGEAACFHPAARGSAQKRSPSLCTSPPSPSRTRNPIYFTSRGAKPQQNRRNIAHSQETPPVKTSCHEESTVQTSCSFPFMRRCMFVCLTRCVLRQNKEIHSGFITCGEIQRDTNDDIKHCILPLDPSLSKQPPSLTPPLPPPHTHTPCPLPPCPLPPPEADQPSPNDLLKQP